MQVNAQLYHLKEQTKSLASELSSNLLQSHDALTSMFTTMAQMEQKIGALHEAVDGYGFVWMDTAPPSPPFVGLRSPHGDPASSYDRLCDGRIPTRSDELCQLSCRSPPDDD